MTTSLPYLPTEMMEIIFDYKEAYEAKDTHNALTKALIVEYLDLPWGDGISRRDRGRRYYLRWRCLFNEHFCYIDSNRNMKPHTSCRRCHNISEDTLDSEFAGNEHMAMIKGPYWGGVECGGCLTPKEKIDEDVVWCAIKGGTCIRKFPWSQPMAYGWSAEVAERAKDHPFWHEDGEGRGRD
tara:strand:- start:305 stop:850 length:546 start_codon:yes stop_codon:yes gene_type:complete